MMQTLKHFSLVAFVFVAFFMASSPRHSVAVDTQKELRESVSMLNRWLGTDDKARRWRQILNLNVLDAQAALGHRADMSALSEIRRRFQRSTAHLANPMFDHVSRKIDAHLQQLQRSNIDIANAIDQAADEFRPAELSDFEKMRRQAIANVEALKRYYKITLTSRPRALLFYDLKPDATVEFLTTIKFELPPARSRAMIDAEIQGLETQIKAVDQQIETLNQQREKIRQWLKEIEAAPVPDDADPPMPDASGESDSSEDEQAEESAEPANEVVNEQDAQDSKPSEQETAESEREIQSIETGRARLQDQKQELEDQLKALQVEMEQLTVDERARVGRFRETMQGLGRHVAVYETLRTQQADVFFANAHQSLDGLRDAYLLAANPGVQRAYVARLKQLKLAFQSLAESNNRRSAAEVGALLGWIEDAGQVPDLVAAIRKRYSQPNLYFEISRGMINRAAGRSVRENRPVREQILGRLIRGRAAVDGQVSVELQPDPHQVHATIEFSGDIHSDTYTRSGRLTAYAGADAQFYAQRPIFGNTGGVFAGPVWSHLDLQSHFKCIDSNLRLVQKFAVREYEKTKQKAEAISRVRTAKQVFPAFKDETDTALEAAYSQLDSVGAQKVALGQWLPALYAHTTRRNVVVVAHKATDNDLAATTGPASYPEIRSDVGARIHETMLSNYISPLLAGKKLSNQEIAERFEEFLGRSIAAEDGQQGEQFTVSFDDSRPIQVEFEGNKIAVTISGKEFSKDGNRIREGMRIHMSFKFASTDEGLQFVPAEKVRVELINPDRINITNTSFIAFLEERLNSVLAEAADSDFVLPDNLIPVEVLGPKMQEVAEQLQLIQLRMEGGWLYGGWKKTQLNQATVVDLPAIWDSAELEIEEEVGSTFSKRAPVSDQASTNAN